MFFNKEATSASSASLNWFSEARWLIMGPALCKLCCWSWWGRGTVCNQPCWWDSPKSGLVPGPLYEQWFIAFIYVPWLAKGDQCQDEELLFFCLCTEAFFWQYQFVTCCLWAVSSAQSGQSLHGGSCLWSAGIHALLWSGTGTYSECKTKEVEEPKSTWKCHWDGVCVHSGESVFQLCTESVLSQLCSRWLKDKSGWSLFDFHLWSGYSVC